MNDALFDRKVKDKGLKFNFIARQLDITEFGLMKKRKGTIPWKVCEINTLTQMLNLSQDERDDIFGLISTK